MRQSENIEDYYLDDEMLDKPNRDMTPNDKERYVRAYDVIENVESVSSMVDRVVPVGVSGPKLINRCDVKKGKESDQSLDRFTTAVDLLKLTIDKEFGRFMEDCFEGVEGFRERTMRFKEMVVHNEEFYVSLRGVGIGESYVEGGVSPSQEESQKKREYFIKRLIQVAKVYVDGKLQKFIAEKELIGNFGQYQDEKRGELVTIGFDKAEFSIGMENHLMCIKLNYQPEA